MNDQKQAEHAGNINYLMSTMDAKVWTDEYCKRNTSADHGTMLAWFASAIMAGYDEANRRNQAAQTAPVEPQAQEPVAWACWIDGADPKVHSPFICNFEPIAYKQRRPLGYLDVAPVSAVNVPSVGAVIGQSKAVLRLVDEYIDGVQTQETRTKLRAGLMDLFAAAPAAPEVEQKDAHQGRITGIEFDAGGSRYFVTVEIKGDLPRELRTINGCAAISQSKQGGETA